MIRYLCTCVLQIVSQKFSFIFLHLFHFIFSFIVGLDSNEEEEDIPLWVDGVQETDEDLESKTLLFEESIRRSLR